MKCNCGGKIVIPSKKVPPKKVAPKKVSPKKITNTKRSARLKKINTRRATKAANASAKGCKCQK
jgi:hypothetical protein